MVMGSAFSPAVITGVYIWPTGTQASNYLTFTCLRFVAVVVAAVWDTEWVRLNYKGFAKPLSHWQVLGQKVTSLLSGGCGVWRRNKQKGCAVCMIPHTCPICRWSATWTMIALSYQNLVHFAVLVCRNICGGTRHSSSYTAASGLGESCEKTVVRSRDHKRLSTYSWFPDM